MLQQHPKMDRTTETLPRNVPEKQKKQTTRPNKTLIKLIKIHHSAIHPTIHMLHEWSSFTNPSSFHHKPTILEDKFNGFPYIRVGKFSSIHSTGSAPWRYQCNQSLRQPLRRDPRTSVAVSLVAAVGGNVNGRKKPYWCLVILGELNLSMVTSLVALNKLLNPLFLRSGYVSGGLDD